MNARRDDERLPRSIRKHLRSEKARLRRELPPEEARRAIERLTQAFRREAVTPAERDGRTKAAS